MNAHIPDNPRCTILAAGVFLILLAAASPSGLAQQIQIPPLQICNQTRIVADATVRIASRADANHAGMFEIQGKITCGQATKGIPQGALVVRNISLTDSTLNTAFVAKTIEQVTSAGKHSPMAFVSGLCDWHGTPCRYWIMLADNKGTAPKGTPDVAAFIVLDMKGSRINYGTGPAVKGDIDIDAGQ